jgi:uncharacterized membrane protein
MRVVWYSTLLMAALAPLSLSSALPARADLKLCNFTPSRVGIAIGYKRGKEWITEGWWNVLSQSCETLVTGELSARFYYIHALDYDRGGEWAGKIEMCTADKTFTIKGVKDCGGRGYKTSKFYEVDTGESKDYTVRLIDPPSGAATQ